MTIGRSSTAIGWIIHLDYRLNKSVDDCRTATDLIVGLFLKFLERSQKELLTTIVTLRGQVGVDHQLQPKPRPVCHHYIIKSTRPYWFFTWNVEKHGKAWVRGYGCIVWLYYACSYTVALSSGLIPSFAVLHIEKLAFQCATLLNWSNLSVLCHNNFFFFFFFERPTH